MGKPIPTNIRFIASKVDRICHPKNIAFMRKRLPDKPEVTAEERTAFIEACAFARKWNSRSHDLVFGHGLVAKHCTALLAIRKRHFPFHSLMACAKGLLWKPSSPSKNIPNTNSNPQE